MILVTIVVIRIRLVAINNMKVCLSDRMDCMPRTIIGESDDRCISLEGNIYESLRTDNLHCLARRNNKRMSRQCWRTKLKISSYNVIGVDKLSD